MIDLNAVPSVLPGITSVQCRCYTYSLSENKRNPRITDQVYAFGTSLMLNPRDHWISNSWKKKREEKEKRKISSPSPRDLQPSQLETISRRQGNGTVFDSALLASSASWVHLVLGFQGWCKSGCASVWGCWLHASRSCQFQEFLTNTLPTPG